MAYTPEKKERSGREVLDGIELSLAELTSQIVSQKSSEQFATHAYASEHTESRRSFNEGGKELYNALHEAQRAFKDIEKSGFIGGRNIRYAKISDLVDASRAALHANDLVVSTYHTAYPN